MNKIKSLLVFVGLLLLSVSTSWAQATLTETTLSAAISDKAEQTFTVTSATGFSAGRIAYVDKEALRITAVSGTLITAVRGASGTRATTHASAATIYVGPANYFTTYDRAGSCTSTSELVLPVVNVSSGNIFQCTSSLWVIINSPGASATGLTALGPATAGDIDVGSATLPFDDIFIAGTSGTPATNNFRITGASTSGTRVITLPDATASLAPLVSPSFTTPAIGAATGTSLDLTGSLDVGVAGTTVGTVTFRNATTGVITLQPTTGALGTVAVTLPAADITVSGATAAECGTAAACSPTTLGATPNILIGSVALSSGTPSTVTVTALSPAYTSTATYHCATTPVGNTAAIAAGGVAITYVSGSSFTLTGPNSVSTVIDYVCIGN